MQEIRSILAAVDRDALAPVVARRAATLARLTGARLELFHCDAVRAYVQKHQYDREGAALVRESCLADARQYLATLRRGLQMADVAIHAACESPLYVSIVQEVMRLQPDLVVRGAGEIFDGVGVARGLGASEWDLIRTCPAPLLLTRGRAWQARPLLAVAIELARAETLGLTRALLRFAGALAEASGGELELVHVGTAEAGAPTTESRRSTLIERASDAGVAVAAVHAIVGDASVVLPQFAVRRGYDLLALGALTHRTVLPGLVGTLTGRLIETLESDFLLVKPGAEVATERSRPTARGSESARASNDRILPPSH